MVENVAPTQTWEALQADANAQLVDVRTDAEWNFVGVPDLAASGKQAVLIPWQNYPAMQRNGQFVANLRCPQHGRGRGGEGGRLPACVQRGRRV
jgi:rhodanese-related sulfurtransferase